MTVAHSPSGDPSVDAARSGTPPVVLAIAGSDSGAGAGIQADLKAISALGVFATTAVTAVTAQNTTQVTAVLPLPTDIVDAQIQAVLDDFPVAAVKTGMLATEATVEAVVARASAGQLPSLVVDPVLVASSGRPLLETGAIDSYRQRLLPHALVVTPNLYEAAILAGSEPDEAVSQTAGATVEDMVALAQRIADLGPRWVLVKGGHLPGVHGSNDSEAPELVTDVLLGPSGATLLTAALVATTNNHGTGCTLASATAAGLACGLAVPEAVTQAKEFVHRALIGGATWRLGSGHGPLDHFGWGVVGPPHR